MPMRPIRLLLAACAIALPAAAIAGDGPRPAADASSIRPLLVGAAVPQVTVRDGAGEPVDLRARLMRQRTVVVFYRGGW